MTKSVDSIDPIDPIEMTTTAIVYPNSRIHVGWAWECLGADWRNRALQALGKDTFFCTGMDEHSLNVQRKAEEQGKEPKKYCDQMAVDIEKVLKMMGIEYDRFIRTSDEDHVRVVHQLIQRAFDSGDIYQAKYEGHYCESCEAYYVEADLVDGKCPQHQQATRWLSEENYFFKLSKYEKPLLELYEKNPSFLEPAHRRAEVVSFLKQGLKDFSISRSTFTWGIPLPFEKGHVIYVWFDALINYLTAAGVEAHLKDPSSDEAKIYEKRWANALHIIGKDITRFHCIYWPAMLMSMKIPLPKAVFAHGFIQLKGEKMSKTTGNLVTPDEVIDVTGPDAFRYYLLAENQFSQDGNFGWEPLIQKCNADLANDWGNLVNRSISMTRKYFPDAKLSAPADRTHSKKVYESFQKLRDELATAVEAMDPSAFAKACTDRSRVLNLYIDEMKPWKMAKDDSQKESLAEVLYTLLEGVRWVATAFLPILPFGMPKVFEQLGVPSPKLKASLENLSWAEHSFQPVKPSPIYPRLELLEKE